MINKILDFIKARLYTVLILAAIFAAAGFWYYSSVSKKSSYEFVRVTRGDVLQIVSVTGKVKPADSVDLAFEKSGKVASIAVRVGDKVAAGQRLATLSNSDLVAQLAQAQASLEKEIVKLAELKSGTRPEELQIAQTTVANATKTLADVKNKAEVDLNNYYDDVKDILSDAYVKADDAVNKQTDELFINDNSSNPKLSFYSSEEATSNAVWKRRQAGTELEQFKQELDALGSDRAVLDLALIKSKAHLDKIMDFLNSAATAVNESSGLTATNLTNYKYYVNTGRTNVNTALTAISTQGQYIATQKAANQSDISAAQNTLAAAQDQLALKQAGSTADEIAAQEAQIKYARANMQNYEAALSKTVIFSPLNGIVTKQEIEIGEIVAANATVISVLSATKFEIEANVSENEIAKIVLGDTAAMTLDALGPAEKFTGTISAIDPAETVVSGVIYYKVTSVFDADDARIKSGMTVNMDIRTDKKENVLTLPYYAVMSRNSEKFVQVLTDGRSSEKTVQTGLEGETMIEITGGLQEGENIIVSKQ
ncbi:MAG: efflux RND transporter periplasmic adaptor subunit [Candidatus Portnoybacteria bacterium]|nr:efflux RND transporter periplasmic adaptor subunit [Candidatus Portnoybacteria bacterium]MDD4983144.1 efflux RND transporter periplasmic adaptor subunit [Candidatus Portnoybacteria bacterium]